MNKELREICKQRQIPVSLLKNYDDIRIRLLNSGARLGKIKIVIKKGVEDTDGKRIKESSIRF